MAGAAEESDGLPPGAVLALESSGRTGSVAVETAAGRIVERPLPDRRGHGSRILPSVADALAEAGVAPRELAAVAVGAGPGSFTGVRVAASAGLGLAGAAGAPLFAVSSLAAGVLPAFGPGSSGILLVCFDARGERLFVAGYRWRGGDLTVPVPPRFARVGEVLAGEIGVPAEMPGPLRCAGAGAERHREALAGAGLDVAPAPAGVPSARGLLAVARVAPGLVERWGPGSEPHYLRATSAERGV